MAAQTPLDVYQKVYDAWIAARDCGKCPELAWTLYVVMRELATQHGFIVP